MHVVSSVSRNRYRIKRHYGKSKCKPVLDKHELNYTVDLLNQQVGGSHSDLCWVGSRHLCV